MSRRPPTNSRRDIVGGLLDIDDMIKLFKITILLMNSSANKARNDSFLALFADLCYNFSRTTNSLSE